MHRYLFFLGISPLLGKREVVDVLMKSGTKPKHVSLFQSLLLLESTKRVDIRLVQQKLGGTIKSGVVVASPSSNVEALSLIGQRLGQRDTKKITFSLFGAFDDPEKDAYEIKKSLSMPARFVSSEHWHGLSPEYSASKEVYEFGLVSFNREKLLVEILAVSDTRGFRLRDRLRPAVLTSEGIMPPKLARMLVNIGLSNASISNPVVVDPFCGSGTILSEALSLGYDTRGMDNSQDALTAATKNLNAIFGESIPSLVLGDATQYCDLEKILDHNSTVVTESYLGPATPRSTDHGQIADELLIMHQTWIAHSAKLLSKGATVIVALPDYLNRISEELVEKVIDAATDSGYTLFLRPTKYRQHTAVVGRILLGIKK